MKLAAQSVLELACAEVRMKGNLRAETFTLLLGELERDPESLMTFPSSRFRFASVVAEEFERRGDTASARTWAKAALQAADAASPFPRHKDVGLATASPEERARLERLAGS